MRGAPFIRCRREWRVVIAAVSVACLALLSTGCGMSARKAFEMRDAIEAEDIAENQADLQEYLAEPDDDAMVRALAMESAVVLSDKADLPRTTPASYANLVKLMTEEAAEPKVEEDEVENKDRWYLRGMALEMLGRLKDTDQVPTILGALERVSFSGTGDAIKPLEGEDARYAVGMHVAGLNALVPMAPEFKAKPALRNRLLTVLPKLDSNQAGDSLEERAAAQEVERLRHSFEASLYDLDSVTDLLNEQFTSNADQRSVSHALEWDLRLLRDGLRAKGAGMKDDTATANIAILVQIALSKREKLAHESRAILLESAPWSLAAAEVGVVHENPAGRVDFLEELANLTPRLRRLDADYRSAPGRTGAVRTVSDGGNVLDETSVRAAHPLDELVAQTLDATWTYAAGVDAPKREFLYDMWMADSPAALATHLAGRLEALLAEPEASVLQAARLLGNMIEQDRLAADATLAETATRSLARLVAVESVPVRNLVAGYLLSRRPGLLAWEAAPSLRKIASASGDNAQVLLDIHTNCLKEIDAEAAKGDEARALFSQSDDLPLPILANVFDRSEIPLKRQAFSFLISRDKDLSAMLLADRVGSKAAEPDAFALRVLGDFLLQEQQALGPAVFAASATAIGSSIPRLPNEDLALRAARYLAELRQRPEALNALLDGGAQAASKYPALRILLDDVRSKPAASQSASLLPAQSNGGQ